MNLRFFKHRKLEPSAKIINFDQSLFWVVIAILIWGIVMVYSASVPMSNDSRYDGLHQNFFLIRDCISVSFGLIAAVFAYQVNLKTWERFAPHLFVLSLVLLVAVLIPYIGKGVNGSRRWIGLIVVNFQPSEFAKLTILLYASNYMVRKMAVKERFFKAVFPMGVALIVTGFLLLIEPDFGAFMVIAVIAMGILFLGGVNASMFFLSSGVLGLSFVGMIAFNSWRRARFFAYLDPWDMQHALGKGYQLSHSLIAFGRGEFFGVGLGRSIEKLNWLPEAHTDFLMAVIGEEFGFIGVFVLLLLFLWMVRRIMKIGRQAIVLDDIFSGLYAQGVGIWIGFQSFINIGVNLGLLPTKGLTLPLMSYGGSAVIINLVALAIVFRIDMENRAKMRDFK
jgi:cell division protein FtsW